MAKMSQLLSYRFSVLSVYFMLTLSTVYYGHVWTQSQNVLIICSIALVLEHY